MYNIVYSITFHQEVDLVNHFLKNIEKYNIKNNYLVIIHLSEKLYKIRDKIYTKNVIINPIHYDKKLNTHLLTKPFIENFEYLISQKIRFCNFMTLTSSNRFVRQAPYFKCKEEKLCENKIIQNIDNNTSVWFHWPAFIKNKKIIKIFQDNQICLKPGQVEGRLYSYELMLKICEFIKKNNIMNIIENEMPFEEIIFPSLATYYTNKPQTIYCHTFYNKKETKSVPTVSEVIEILKEKPHIFIIKRFPDDLNHILFDNPKIFE